MAGTGPGDLETLADDLLQASIDALDTVPVAIPGLLGAPERSFISPHLPALDCCDQLTVHVPAIVEADTVPGGLGKGTRHRMSRMNHVALTVTITRCVPIIDGAGNLPALAELTAASEQLLADGWALWNHVWNLVRAKQLFSYCGEVHWDGLRPLGPEGGCAGWTLAFTVSLDGYEETLGT
jgi:hypothetical protein